MKNARYLREAGDQMIVADQKITWSPAEAQQSGGVNFFFRYFLWQQLVFVYDIVRPEI